jgi:hypothetical protein
MGGATAMMTAAQNRGLDGLILIDAWNIGGAVEGRETREGLIASFNDFGHALHGASPESVADEVLAKRGQWDLAAVAPKVAPTPVLSVTAKYGGAVPNRVVTAALRKARVRVTAVELNSDHPFSDHRIALAQTVVDWLDRLPVRP